MTHSQKAEPQPPRWMELMLRMILKQRDRDAISGDLLEEYREDVFPEKGRLGANRWYLCHVVSFLDGVSFGVAIGLLLSAWMVTGTLVFLLTKAGRIRRGKSSPRCIILLRSTLRSSMPPCSVPCTCSLASSPAS